MKKIILALVFLIAISTAYALSNTLDIQGDLRNASTGDKLTGTYSFNITLFNITNDEHIYSENISLSITNGIYNYIVGNSVSILDEWFDDGIYYRLKVEDELMDSRNFSINPYSYYSHKSNNSDFLGWIEASEYSKDLDNATIQRTYNLDTSVNNTDINVTKVITPRIDGLVGDAVKIGSGDDSNGLASSNDLFVTGKLESNGHTYLDGDLTAVGNIYLGASNKDVYILETNNADLFMGRASGFPGAHLRASSSHDQFYFGLDSSEVGYSFVLADLDHLFLNRNYDHSAQSNPTLFIHSSTDPNTDNAQWIGLTHNKSLGEITTGTGDIYMNSATGNISMKSPDGTVWSCGVDNSGSIVCT